ncbi:Hypothetical protein PSEBR_m1641 [Pseudomonas brassicacearum subsp. brassicacearum NFM421]|uniref:Secreted protein n=1 Tax=Pseudomonas brassicacearum (strain NFM421) TaxID=994484 RepID=F2K5X8_PSEBN|nr:Hypothetical protein PSEBR_m1641 [Pseudomonas brassicacearum subsp. brassicacearum NFM421]
MVGYPQSLCALLWITCSPLAAPYAKQALQACAQKIVSLTHGFYWLLPVSSYSLQPKLAPNLCWRFCG